MSESLYMMEIEQILEDVSILVNHYGLNFDDTQSEVAAAAGEEP